MVPRKPLVPASDEGFKPDFKVIWTQPFPLARGGENKARAATEIQPNQAVTLENGRIDLDRVEQAYGYTEIGDISAALSTGSDTVVRWIGPYETLDGTTRLVAITQDVVYDWDGTSWTENVISGPAAMTFTGIVNAQVVQDLMVIVGPGDVPQQWTDAGDISELAGTGTAPTAYFVASFGDRCVLARTAANAQLIPWSISGDITNWSGIGSGSVSLVDTTEQGGSDPIMGLEVHGDSLVVYRRDSVWIGRRTGRPEPAFGWQFRHGTGAYAPRSIANAGALGDFYLGRDDVYLYHPRLGEPRRVGTPIARALLDELAVDQTENVVGTYHADRREYWLAIPTTGNTYATKAYILDVEALQTNDQLVWRERTFNSENDSISAIGVSRTANFTDTDGTRKLVLGSNVPEVFDSDSDDTQDAGTDMTMTIVSPEFVLPNRNVQLARLALSYTSSARVDMILDTSIDGGTTWDDPVTYSLPPQSQVEAREFWIRSGTGPAVRFRLRVTDTNRVQFKTYQVGLLPRGVRRRGA